MKNHYLILSLVLALLVLLTGTARAGEGLTSGQPRISAGLNFTCLITDTGGVLCWGDNFSGQLGDGTKTTRRVPTPVNNLGGTAVGIAAGWYHTCALMDGGGVRCWGYNYNGQLGDGTKIDRLMPVDVVGLPGPAIYLTAGWNYTCALVAGGSAYCWGADGEHKLGDGDLSQMDRTTPTHVAGFSSSILTLAVGQVHTCALDADATVHCWGYNGFGQLGNSTTMGNPLREPVVGLGSGNQALAVGWHHTCVVDAGGGVRCWGRNEFGQLGDGSTANRAYALEDPIAGLDSNIKLVTAGFSHSCALTHAGAVWCWGWNTHGQLGNGSFSTSYTPVHAGSGFAALTTGQHHNCGVTFSGDVLCWGLNFNGQLGNYSATNSNTPTCVEGLCAVNSPPEGVSAGGPYTVPEGGSVELTATASDPDGDPLTFVWDLDQDGEYETPGQTVPFSAAGLDGPATFTVSVRVADDKDAFVVAAATVQVENVAPVVEVGDDQTIVVGNPFAGQGSFQDPGPDSWTGEVDYGDGSGSQPLALASDKTFELAHTFSAAGVYVVSATISDDDGGIGTDTLTVTVQTPQEAASDLIDQINQLVADGVLNQGQGNALIQKVAAAIEKIEQGNLKPAINQLNAFINQVNDLVANEVLPEAEGQELIEAALEIISALEG